MNKKKLTAKMLADEVDLAADTLYTMLDNAGRTVDPDGALAKLLIDMRTYANSIYGASYTADGKRALMPWAKPENKPAFLHGPHTRIRQHDNDESD